MNSTAAVLRKIKDICDNNNRCEDCPLLNLTQYSFCYTPPQSWTEKEIEELADIIDDYEEEEE